jgi:hypothetical protein
VAKKEEMELMTHKLLAQKMMMKMKMKRKIGHLEKNNDH